jgi:glycosyltransferase involved in cell wall biosynthesis
MQDKSLVTIICLCYNQEPYVIESLRSVINQDYKLIELIIVDDCSTDHSKSVIEKWLLDYPEIQFIANETNLGSTKSFNKALKIAKGAYIIDLAADDVLLNNCVSLQCNAFTNSPFKNLGMVYGNAALINENGDFDSYYFAVDHHKNVIQKRATGDIYLSVIRGGNSICSVSSMVKKTIFDALNGYDENLAYEDLDFWIRSSRVYEVDFIDKILINKRTVANSLGTTFFKKRNKINNSTFIILKKAIQLNRTKKENKAILKRIHFEMILAFRTSNFELVLKYIAMEIKLRIKILF